MNKENALKFAQVNFAGYTIYVRGNEVIVRDGEELITKIPFIVVE